MTYRDDYRSYERESYWTAPRVVLWLIFVMVMCSGLGLVGCALGLFTGAATNAAEVVKKEFYPDALLRKYEWFKDAAAVLDAKQADLAVYERLLAHNTQTYGPAKQWPRDVRETYALRESEAAGIRASYNQLAAEYNAEMSKFNWRFTNVGDVPKGGQPLPREYRPYQEGQ